VLAAIFLLMLVVVVFMAENSAISQASPPEVVNLPVSQSASQPGRSNESEPAPALTSPFSVMWSKDSSEYWIKCQTENLGECLGELDTIHAELGRNIFSLLVSMVLNPMVGDIHSIRVNFQKGQSNNIPTLNEIQINAGGAYSSYSVSESVEPSTDSQGQDTLFFLGRYCSPAKKCLNGYQAHFVASVRAAIEDCDRRNSCHSVFDSTGGSGVTLLDNNRASIYPFTAGRVTSMISPGAGQFDVQLYHGRGIYTWYHNLAEVKVGLLTGDFLEKNSLLGNVHANADSSRSFYFRIMMEGRLINVYETLNYDFSKGA